MKNYASREASVGNRHIREFDSPPVSNHFIFITKIQNTMDARLLEKAKTFVEKYYSSPTWGAIHREIATFAYYAGMNDAEREREEGAI